MSMPSILQVPLLVKKPSQQSFSRIGVTALGFLVVVALIIVISVVVRR